MDIERKLARIEQVSDLVPIEGADLIELAKIKGWQCVVKKGEFKVGDLAMYFEIDSFLPEDSRYEFLRKNCFKTNDDRSGFRLKTIRLRKQLSQGLLLPMKEFPEVTNPTEGMDCTQLLNVIKYEIPIPVSLRGEIKGNFPAHTPRTDQERIQNLDRQLWDLYKDIPFEVTMKLDGTSCTFYYNNGDTGVCSRNLDLKKPEEGNTNVPVYWDMATNLDILERLKKYGKNISVQGEIVGLGIQGNPEGLTYKKFFCFDVYLQDEKRHALPIERYQILKDLNSINNNTDVEPRIIDHVPVIEPQFHAFRYRFDDLLKMASGPSIVSKIREGIVFKSEKLVDGQVFSFKVINNDYLLSEKD